MYRASKYGHNLLKHSKVIWINRVRLPNLLVVSCIRGKYIDMYWYSTAVCIGLYTRYQYIFLYGDMYIRARFTAVYAYSMCNYSGMYVELV